MATTTAFPASHTTDSGLELRISDIQKLTELDQINPVICAILVDLDSGLLTTKQANKLNRAVSARLKEFEKQMRG